MGWRDSDIPVRVVSLLAHEVLVAEGLPDAVLVETPSLYEAQDIYQSLVSTMEMDRVAQPRVGARVSYVFGAYDGLSTSVLEALEETGGDVPAAFDLLRKANPLIPTVHDKVGVVDEPIIAWDPAEHPYATPTLLVQGTADTFTFRYHAEHIFERAARGPVVKLLLAGVGHSLFFLPKETLRFALFTRFVTQEMDVFVKDPVLGLVATFSAADRAAPIPADEAVAIRTK
jgi:hypothetical protein